MRPQWQFVGTITAIIILLPFVIDVFTQAGAAIIGYEEVLEDRWIPTALAYGPLLVILFVQMYATLLPLSTFGLRRTRELLGAATLLGIAAGILIFLIDILTGTLESFGAPTDPTFGAAIGFFLAWGLLAPFAEELFFRGAIQSRYLKLPSTWPIHPSILIAAGFEVLFHLAVPIYAAPGGQVLAHLFAALPQASYVLVLSGVSGYLYYHTRSIWPAFIFHALGNIVELLLFWLL